MKKLVYLITIILFSVSSFAQLEWESKASLPDYGLDQGVAFAVNGQAYFGLGRRPDNVYSNKIWRYNPTTEIVSPVADYPGNGFVSSIAFTIGNIAYDRSWFFWCTVILS